MAKGSSSKTNPSHSQSYVYRAPLHEKPSFYYGMVLLVIVTLIVSIFALVNVYQLKKSINQRAITIDDFLKKLTSHIEMKSYVGVAPLNVVQINNDNFANLQAQISGLDISYIGNFIVQYTDRIVVYDYDKDTIRGNVALQQPQQGQLPNDFFIKLHKHPELQGLQNEQPVGGRLDEDSLSNLKQQFPDVYANAKVGDFLLRYKTKLIIYDYSQDKIINSINLA